MHSDAASPLHLANMHALATLRKSAHSALTPISPLVPGTLSHVSMCTRLPYHPAMAAWRHMPQSSHMYSPEMSPGAVAEADNVDTPCRRAGAHYPPYMLSVLSHSRTLAMHVALLDVQCAFHCSETCEQHHSIAVGPMHSSHTVAAGMNGAMSPNAAYPPTTLHVPPRPVTQPQQPGFYLVRNASETFPATTATTRYHRHTAGMYCTPS